MFPDGLCELLRRAKVGHPDALEELLHQLNPVLVALGRRYELEDDYANTASDLSQDAGLRLLERLHQFHGTDDDSITAAMLQNWIRQIVRRLAIDRQRNHGVEGWSQDKSRKIVPMINPESTSGNAVTEPSISAEKTVSSIVGGAELDQLVRAGLDEIPDPAEKQILQMCFFESHSLKQIAELLELSYDIVRARYHSGLRFLEHRLKDSL